MSLINSILLFLAISAVAIADVFLKKTQTLGSMTNAFMSPWMLGAVVLYLFQIFFFTYLFISGEKLTSIGIMQTVIYALIVLVSGIFLFGETLSITQMVGVFFAIFGVVLLNIH